jgi:hypothetical protein
VNFVFTSLVLGFTSGTKKTKTTFRRIFGLIWHEVRAYARERDWMRVCDCLLCVYVCVLCLCFWGGGVGGRACYVRGRETGCVYVFVCLCLCVVCVSVCKYVDPPMCTQSDRSPASRPA